MTVEAHAQVGDALAGLDRLTGDLATSLARSMCVAGGKVLRDEAKVLAPVATGKLRDSIYLAFKDNRSSSRQVTYSVTWNASKAPHGHLLEFGHWQPFVTIKTRDGEFITTNVRLPTPKWVAAHPFLRPALDSAASRAISAMIERGRERLPELLAVTQSKFPSDTI